jgi:hypothetical protein
MFETPCEYAAPSASHEGGPRKPVRYERRIIERRGYLNLDAQACAKEIRVSLRASPGSDV